MGVTWHSGTDDPTTEDLSGGGTWLFSSSTTDRNFGFNLNKMGHMY